jgi:hypothetical protein
VVDAAAPYDVLPSAPDAFVRPLQTAVAAAVEHFNQTP